MKLLQLLATVSVILIVHAAADAADDGNNRSWAETMTAARAVYLQSPESKQAAASDSLFKPFDSGSIDGNGPAKQVVVDVSGLKELRLVAICERGPANCNIWGEPKLIARDGTVTRLTDLKPTSVNVGWGQLLVNKNWNDHPLIVGDRQFEFGFWVHADSELTFALDGKYERFEAFVGEDKDRLGGLVQFKVLSTPRPLPDSWADLARDFPLQTGWLRADAGNDGIASWFGRRETGALEQEIIGRALRDVAPDSPLHAERESLVAANAGAGDARWLDLYVRLCRYRDGAASLRTLDSAEVRAALEKELAGLVAAKTPAENACWDQLRVRAVQAGELDHQFASLQYDIQQRAVLSQTTGERVWNGTSYVPTQRSTAEEIASQVFHRSALILESDRDPADIVLRRTRALLDDLQNLAQPGAGLPTQLCAGLPTPHPARPSGLTNSGDLRSALSARSGDLRRTLAAFETPLAKLQQAVADTPVTDTDARRALSSLTGWY